MQLHLRGTFNTLAHLVLKNQDTNLNIAELLDQYRGPVTIVRRDRDDIVGKHDGDAGYVNHTNRLLKSLLFSRYPEIVNRDTEPILDEWLDLYDGDARLGHPMRHMAGHLLEHFQVKCPGCPALLENYMQEHCLVPQLDFPLLVGKAWDLDTREHVTLYLAHRHLKTFAGSHVTYLPTRLLELPWNPACQRQRGS